MSYPCRKWNPAIQADDEGINANRASATLKNARLFIEATLMAVMMVIAMNPRIMGRLTLPRPMLVVGWLATLIMALATVGFFAI